LLEVDGDHDKGSLFFRSLYFGLHPVVANPFVRDSLTSSAGIGNRGDSQPGIPTSFMQ
jgi:hypothetical protein